VRTQLRVVSLALAALLALGALAACGEEDDEPLVDVTRVSVAGAPTEMPTPDPHATPGAGGAQQAGGQAGGQEGAAPGTFRLEGHDIAWRTADQPGPQVEFTVAPGATIELPNLGASAHNFSIDAKNNDGLPDLGISVDMPVGETATAQIPENAEPGRYYYYCNVPGHEPAGMWGYVTIDPQAAAAGGPPPGGEAGEPPPGGAAAGPVRLEGHDIAWRTADQPGPQVNLTVAPGTTIELVNMGATLHNFNVGDLGIDVDMPVGETVTATIPETAAPGTYEFICDIPGHAPAGMVGTLTVQ
jgi:uncharacterized cupredoxin-like copper-binding protein